MGPFSSGKYLDCPGGTSSTRASFSNGTLVEIRCHEAPDVWGRSGFAATEVTGRSFAQVFGEPCLMFDFFMKNTESKIISAMILSEGHVTDLGVGANGASFRFY